MLSMSDATSLLNAIRDGESQAADELLPLVYDELRRLAAKRLRQEPGQSIEATGLVHEAFLRLVGNQPTDWRGRRYFFAAAAEAMRRILIERARSKKSLKRGGKFHRVEVDDLESILPHGKPLAETLAVHEALQDLEHVDAEAAEVVKLRYFVGFTIPDVADSMGISPRKVNALWAYSKAWLFDRLGDDA